MITYIHRNEGNFKRNEDGFTSTVFDLLKYLPSDIFWSILKKSLYQQKLPEVAGEILDLEYWPKWDSTNTSNTDYVEPDLFFRFQGFDLIIEVKRYNERQQNEEKANQQISDEIQAYFNEYEEENKDLYFIQLGGLGDLKDEEDRYVNERKVVICKTDWTKLLDQIVLEKNRLNKTGDTSANSYKRILDDLIKGFEIFGVFKTTWLNSMEKMNITSQTPKNIFCYATKH